MAVTTVFGIDSSPSPSASTTTSTRSTSAMADSPAQNGIGAVTILPAPSEGDGSSTQFGTTQAHGAQSQKKRRIPGACDICKKKKIRCDSGEMPGNRCSNCIQYGLECTHKEVTKTLGSAKGYVESLEARLEKMDRLLSKLLPGSDLGQDVDKLLEEVDVPPALLRNDDETDETMRLTGKLSKLDLNPPQNRFFGKSSTYQLIQTALDLKSQYNGDQSWAEQTTLKNRRPEFWEIPSWMAFNPETEDTSPQYSFPPPDLMTSLVSHYFTQIHPLLPLLHRPTFQKGIDEGLHLTDSHFGATVLLVCALGSRYSEDSRVFVEGSDATQSAGWKWIEQVKLLRTSFFKRTCLHELQAYALFVLFSQSSEIPQGCWSQVGLALRLAQEVGAHRRRLQNSPPTAEDELWKRAFWVLVSIDRLTSSFHGRPCGLQDEDFDLDLPIECDDEFWEAPNPEDRFKQPIGRPSYIAFFNCYLSLMDILAYAMRAIYAIKQPKNMYGRVIQRSEQQTIAELDSAMNNWMDSVPQHLRWNPSSDNQLFLKQSATLYAIYYHVQIFIHRPFIPSPRNRAPTAFPSLAICTNAARSCCHVLESYSRIDNLPLPHLHITTFTAAVILLLNIWSGKRTGFAPNPKREMEDVQRCMNMLKSCEKRWCSAGRFWDVLTELAYAGNVAISDNASPASRPRSRKRRRTTSNDFASLSFSSSGSAERRISNPVISPSSPTHIAPTPASMTFHASLPPDVIAPPPPNFSLPVYSTELGRLPVYGQFSFSDNIAPSQRDTTTRLVPEEPSTTASGYYFSHQHMLQAHENAFFQSRMHLEQSQGGIPAAAGGLGFAYSVPESPPPFPEVPMGRGQLSEGLHSQIGSVWSAIPTGNAPPGGGFSVFSEREVPGLGEGLPMLMDNDTMTMWSSTPTGFELDEWGTYISSVNQITRGMGQSMGDLSRSKNIDV